MGRQPIINQGDFRMPNSYLFVLCPNALHDDYRGQSSGIIFNWIERVGSLLLGSFLGRIQVASNKKQVAFIRWPAAVNGGWQNPPRF